MNPQAIELGFRASQLLLLARRNVKIALWYCLIMTRCYWLSYTVTVLLGHSLVQKDLFNSHPRSLQYNRLTEEPRPEVAHSRFRQLLLSISGFYSRESQLLRGMHCVACWALQRITLMSASKKCRLYYFTRLATQMQAAKICIKQWWSMRPTQSCMKVSSSLLPLFPAMRIGCSCSLFAMQSLVWRRNL